MGKGAGYQTRGRGIRQWGGTLDKGERACGRRRELDKGTMEPGIRQGAGELDKGIGHGEGDGALEKGAGN